MGQLLINLGNQENWLQWYDESRQAQTYPDGTYQALPAFEIPVLFDRRILAVKNFSTTAKATWRFAGNLIQRFQLGSGGTTSTLPIVEATRKPLLVNRTELHIFPLLAPQYELVHEVPLWYQHMRLTIWEYIGPEADSTEDLILLSNSALTRIETKLDSHLEP